MLRKTTATLFIFATIFHFYSEAQQYSFMNFSLENGLPQSQVEVVFAANDGYIWIGTLGGLSKFDGREFKNFTVDDGLLNNQVNAISQDKEGLIWIGTLGGVSVYNGRTFNNIQLKKEFSVMNVTSIIHSKKNIWLSTDGAGICKLSKNKHSYIPIWYDTLNGLPDNHVRTLLMDDSGKLWAGTTKGVVYFNEGSFSHTSIETLSKINVSQIIKNKEGNIVISTFGDGLFVLKNNQLLNIRKENDIISDHIRHVICDQNNNLWLSTKKGISKISISENLDNYLNISSENGLSFDNINCLELDAEGNLWLGTDGKGLMKFAGESFENYTTRDGLSNDIVMSLIEDNENNIFFSTYGNGICKKNFSKSENISSFLTINNGLINNTVWSSCRDHNNTLWFGTSDGVSCVKDNKIINYKTDNGLISNKVTSIYEDKEGNIWFGTKDGVSKFDGNLFQSFGDKNGFAGKNIRDIIQTNDGKIWFGSSYGLFSFDGNNFTNYNTTDGLSDNTVYSIEKDNRENLWLGTKNGLTFFDGKNFRIIKTGDSYNSNFINFLLFDKSDLWIGTNNGIYRLDASLYVETGEISTIHFTNWEGLSSLECNLNGAFKDSKSNLWFCTSSGVLKFNQENKITTQVEVEPFISISSVQLFFEDQDWSNFVKEYEKISNLPKGLKVNYNQNHFTFNFAGISFVNPLKIKYKFKLDGFDSDWSPVSGENSATYSNLSPGNYMFNVVAKNKYGVWSKEPAVFSFVINPPFWQTWWFYLICSIIALFIGYGIYVWRTNINKRRIETQKLIYKSKMLVLEQKALNASMNRHFIFNALNSIQYYINKQDKRSANLYLSNFAKLIRKNLDDAQNNLISLSEELERLELYLSLENMRFTDKFDYEIKVEEGIDKELTKIPSMLLQPFVENSISHGILPMNKKGKVSINIKKNNGHGVLFEIMDNGIGFEQSMLSKQLQHNGHSSKGVDISKGRLNLIREMTNKNVYINGPMELKDENNQIKGTKVEIVLQPN